MMFKIMSRFHMDVRVADLVSIISKEVGNKYILPCLKPYPIHS